MGERWDLEGTESAPAPRRSLERRDGRGDFLKDPWAAESPVPTRKRIGENVCFSGCENIRVSPFPVSISMIFVPCGQPETVGPPSDL